MKTLIVLNGLSKTIENQIEEINAFISKEAYLKAIEVIVFADEELDFNKLLFVERIKKVNKIVVKKDQQTSEELVDLVEAVYRFLKPEVIVCPSDFFGHEIAVRVAARVLGSSGVDVRKCQLKDHEFFIEKLVYSNNLNAIFKMKKKPYCIAIAKGMKGSGLPVVEKLVEEISLDMEKSHSMIEIVEIQINETEEGLDSAPVVIAVGRGIGRKENLKIIEELAGLLNGKIGASRPVVMNAWTDMNQLVGASGTIIKPELCIVIGASGAAAFGVGIENSQKIIAINNDEKAAIIKMADVAIIDDYQPIIEKLIDKIKKVRCFDA